MGLKDLMLRWALPDTSPEMRASLRDPDPALKAFFGVIDSGSGIPVNEHLALNLASVFSAVRILSETLASLPLKLYERDLVNNSRTHLATHPLQLLLQQPNPDMTAFTLFETAMAHVAIWGNAFMEVERNRAGGVRALWPLLPDRTKAERIGGVLRYKTRVNNREVEIPARNILHVPGLGWDGTRGYSIVSLARESIGLGLATERFGSKFFGNGARPMGILTGAQRFTNEKQRQEFRETWEGLHQGPDNFNKVAVLEGDLKWQDIGTPPEDAQFLQTRQFQLREVARWFRLPPHLLGDLADATFSNVEHQGLEFVTYTMRPWLVRWEQAITRTLIAPAEQGRVFPEFLVEGLLRGDIKTRYEAYSRGRQNGFLSSNDIRRLENMTPLGPEGDVYTVQLNMQNLEDLLTTPDDPDAPDDGATATRALLVASDTEERGLTSRRRLENRHRRLIKDRANRAVEKEVGAARRALKAAISDGGNIEDFRDWISRFYATHRDFLIRNFEPVFAVLGAAMYAEASREVGGPEELTESAEIFVSRYVEGMSTRIVSSSEGQLRELLGEASPEAVPFAIERRLNEWEQTKADKITQRNLRQAGNAIAMMAWSSNGVTRKVWRTVGKNCPLCERLNGTVVGIDVPFVPSGDEVDPQDGKTTPLRATQDFKHPPLHSGCDCIIMPG